MPPRNPRLAQAVALSAAGRNAEAVLIVNELAASNDPDGLFTLAEMTWRGGMVPSNPPRGRELFRRAAAAGHAGAAIYETNLLANGVAGPRDWPAALKRLREEAKRDPKRKRAWQLLRDMALTPTGDPVAAPAGRRASESPDVTLFPALLSAAECDYLRALAEPDYTPSVVNHSSGRTVADPIRTSDGSTLHWLIEDPAVHALNRRLAAASGSDAAQGEAMQILRYRQGQQYRPHTDFVRASGNPRVLTALVWLNADYQGGETLFTKTGLQVKGKKGDAVVFRNALPDRSLDPMSEHAGLPVTGGVKYLASRWIRDQRWSP